MPSDLSEREQLDREVELMRLRKRGFRVHAGTTEREILAMEVFQMAADDQRRLESRFAVGDRQRDEWRERLAREEEARTSNRGFFRRLRHSIHADGLDETPPEGGEWLRVRPIRSLEELDLARKDNSLAPRLKALIQRQDDKYCRWNLAALLPHLTEEEKAFCRELGCQMASSSAP